MNYCELQERANALVQLANEYEQDLPSTTIDEYETIAQHKYADLECLRAVFDWIFCGMTRRKSNTTLENKTNAQIICQFIPSAFSTTPSSPYGYNQFMEKFNSTTSSTATGVNRIYNWFRPQSLGIVNDAVIQPVTTRCRSAITSAYTGLCELYQDWEIYQNGSIVGSVFITRGNVSDTMITEGQVVHKTIQDISSGLLYGLKNNTAYRSLGSYYNHIAPAYGDYANPGAYLITPQDAGVDLSSYPCFWPSGAKVFSLGVKNRIYYGFSEHKRDYNLESTYNNFYALWYMGGRTGDRGTFGERYEIQFWTHTGNHMSNSAVHEHWGIYSSSSRLTLDDTTHPCWIRNGIDSQGNPILPDSARPYCIYFELAFKRRRPGCKDLGLDFLPSVDTVIDNDPQGLATRLALAQCKPYYYGRLFWTELEQYYSPEGTMQAALADLIAEKTSDMTDLEYLNNYKLDYETYATVTGDPL